MCKHSQRAVSTCLPSGLQRKLELKVVERKTFFCVFYLHIVDLKPLNEAFLFQKNRCFSARNLLCKEISCQISL